MNNKSSPMKILIVEDDVEQLDSLRFGLHLRDYETAAARNAEEALQLFEKDDTEFDIILTDYLMPVIDGLDFVKQIKTKNSDFPVLFMTGYASNNIIIQALRNNCNGFIEKPFTIEELVEEIERVITSISKDAKTFNVSEITPHIRHQIKNSLTSILGNAELGLFQMHDIEKGKANLQNIIKATEEIQRMNHDVLSLGMSLEDADSRIRGIESGADDFIIKPPQPQELLARTRSLLKGKRLNENLTSMHNVLISMANAVEAKDPYTQGHAQRVAELAVNLGRKMRLSQRDIEALKIGGVLHDEGKIGVSNKILNKSGPLNHEEWETIKKHSLIGYDICWPLKKNLGAALDVIRHHHEKLDGSGYPDGLQGDAISLSARIMAVVDIYDALTSERPYRRSMSRDKALHILQEEARNGQLDPDILHNLNELLDHKEIRSGACSGRAGKVKIPAEHNAPGDLAPAGLPHGVRPAKLQGEKKERCEDVFPA